MKKEYPGSVSQHARNWITEVVEDGHTAICPTCDAQHGYQLSLSHDHGIELVRLAQKANEQASGSTVSKNLLDQSIHVPSQLGREAESYSTNCLAQCKHFGLVRSTKPGWWRLTALGRDFLFRHARVPKAAWMDKGEVIHYIDDAGKIVIFDLITQAEYDRYGKRRP